VYLPGSISIRTSNFSDRFGDDRNALEDQTESELSFAEYGQYGHILSSILIRGDRNYDLAELCYLQCLLIKPRSSKILHQVGSLYLSRVMLIQNGSKNYGVHIFEINFLLHMNVSQEKDIDKALLYFQRALSVQPENFGAIKDILLTLLGMRPLNMKKIDDIFTRGFDEKCMWTEKQCTTLSFLQGCYNWLIGDKNAAFSTWMGMDLELCDNFKVSHSYCSSAKDLRGVRAI